MTRSSVQIWFSVCYLFCLRSLAVPSLPLRLLVMRMSTPSSCVNCWPSARVFSNADAFCFLIGRMTLSGLVSAHWHAHWHSLDFHPSIHTTLSTRLDSESAQLIHAPLALIPPESRQKSDSWWIKTRGAPRSVKHHYVATRNIPR